MLKKNSPTKNGWSNKSKISKDVYDELINALGIKEFSIDIANSNTKKESTSTSASSKKESKKADDWFK